MITRDSSCRRGVSRRLAAVVPAVAATTAIALTSAGCASSGSPGASAPQAAGGTFPVTVTAANGAVHVAKRPASIISLSPVATEMLYAIGAGSQVKAVDQDSSDPARAPRTNLSGLNPNIEAIVARKPNLVVVSYDAPTLTKKLAPFGIPVLDLPAPTAIGGVFAEFSQLGKVTGHVGQASAEVASLRKQIAAIVAQVHRRSKPLTYYYELDQTYYSVTSATFVGKLLGLLGMKSIADAAKGAAASGGYPQLSAEYIVKSNPGYIILADTICCHQDATTVAARPGWSGMTAVKAHHVIALNDNLASRWGPTIPGFLRAVLKGIQGSR